MDPRFVDPMTVRGPFDPRREGPVGGVGDDRLRPSCEVDMRFVRARHVARHRAGRKQRPRIDRTRGVSVRGSNDRRGEPLGWSCFGGGEVEGGFHEAA